MSSTSSVSLSSRILQGDMLRCILAYFRHADLNLLRRVNHALEIEANKVTMWPPHLRIIRPREKNFLAQFTSSKSNTQPPLLRYVHQLDLRYVSSPRIKYLLHFTHLVVLRLNVRSLPRRDVYARTLEIFLAKCGATIKHLHLDIDPSLDLSLLCRHIPALEQLDLATSYPHISRAYHPGPAGDDLIADSIRGLTSKVNPCLKRIRVLWYSEKSSGYCQKLDQFTNPEHMKKSKAVLKEMETLNVGSSSHPVSLESVIRLLHREAYIGAGWTDQTTVAMEKVCMVFPSLQVQQVGLSLNIRHGEKYPSLDEINRFCAAYDKLCALHPVPPSLHLLLNATSSIERYLGPLKMIPGYMYQPQFNPPPTPSSGSPTSNYISFYGFTHDLLQPLFDRCHMLNIECFADRLYQHDRHSTLVVAPPVALDTFTTFFFGDNVLQETATETADPTASISTTADIASSSFSSFSSLTTLLSTTSTFSNCRNLRSIHLWPVPAQYTQLTQVQKFAEVLQSQLRVRNKSIMQDVRVEAIPFMKLQQDERWQGIVS